jgi:hypothetical protein
MPRAVFETELLQEIISVEAAAFVDNDRGIST